MKTYNEINSMLENESNSYTAIRVADANGANVNYGACEIDALIDAINNYDYDGCELANADNVDLDVWGQGLNADNVAALRETMAAGNLYIAKYSSDENGTMEILIWA